MFINQLFWRFVLRRAPLGVWLVQWRMLIIILFFNTGLIMYLYWKTTLLLILPATILLNIKCVKTLKISLTINNISLLGIYGCNNVIDLWIYCECMTLNCSYCHRVLNKMTIMPLVTKINTTYILFCMI